jgi:hypothetical protein
MLFDEKSIRKDSVKGENWSNGKGTKDGFRRKWDYAGMEFSN